MRKEQTVCRRIAMAWGVMVLTVFGWGCQQSMDEGQPDGQAKTVLVHWAGQIETIDLGRLDSVEQAGREVVAVDGVVRAAFERVALTEVAADFVAVDGFRPAGKSLCRTLIPVPGDQLAKAYLDVASANLLWDDDLGYSGCLFVQQVAELRLYPDDSSVTSVHVSLGDIQAEVGLEFLPAREVDGRDAVALRTVVMSSGLSESVDLYRFAFQTSQTTSTDLGLAALGWDALAAGSIRVDDRSLVWSTLPDQNPAWSLSEVTGIQLVDPAGQAASLTVVWGDQTATVNLGNLAVEQVQGEQLVGLRSVVIASSLTDQPENFRFDFEGVDGFRPHVDRGFDPLDWQALSNGWIHPRSASLTWDDELGLPAAWWVSEVARIHLLTP